MPKPKNMSVPEPAIPMAIVLLAALLRLPLLGIKPPHFDEGVNGFFVDQITRTGFYHYDPANFHGPMHMYVLFLFQTLFGRHIWALRLPEVIVSLATVWLVTRFDRFLDRRACWFAALAMAVSPAMVFYSRYAIHESWLVFFLVLLVWGAAGLWVSGERKYLWAVGLSLAGMLLTKETYCIHVACFLLAAGCVWLLEKVSPPTFSPLAKQRWTGADMGAVLAVSTFAVVFFYSGGFLDRSSLKGIWQTYAIWGQRGSQGAGQEKDWWYWLWLMKRYEQPALLGMVCCPVALLPKQNRLLRFLSIYGVGTWLAYSLVPYKTPWCIVSLLWPFYFALGAVLADLTTRYGKAVSIVAAVACVLVSGALSVRLNFLSKPGSMELHATDEKEPYVYVQTYREIEKLTGPVFQLTGLDPRNHQMSGLFILSSYHPLAWVFGDFPHVAFYDEDKMPEEADADFLLVEEDRVEDTEKTLKGSYFTDSLHLRDAMPDSKLYLSFGKFSRIFPGRAPDFSPSDRPSSPESSAR